MTTHACAHAHAVGGRRSLTALEVSNTTLPLKSMASATASATSLMETCGHAVEECMSSLQAGDGGAIDRLTSSSSPTDRMMGSTEW